MKKWRVIDIIIFTFFKSHLLQKFNKVNYQF